MNARQFLAEASAAPSRGYLLLEAMIGGVLLAVALTSAMGLLGFYRRETTMAARRAEASAIAIGVADELVTRDFGVGFQVPTAVPDHRGFTTAWTITESGLEGSSTPALGSASELHLIDVIVTFPSTDGPASINYQRLKRNPE